MNPKTVFEQNFRAPAALLKVYRLLQFQEGAPEELATLIREHLAVPNGEETFIISNNALHGLVRELAELPAVFFRERSLAVLLRQAIVAASWAADVYYNSVISACAVEILMGRMYCFRGSWTKGGLE